MARDNCKVKIEKEGQKEWIKAFKVATIEGDENLLVHMMESMPLFEDIEDMRTALALIREATKQLENKKKSLAKEMLEIKEAKKFLTSTKEESKIYRRLDVHS